MRSSGVKRSVIKFLECKKLNEAYTREIYHARGTLGIHIVIYLSYTFEFIAR